LVDRIVAKAFQDRRGREVHMKYLSMAGKRGLLGYTRELIIDIGPSLTPEALEVYLPHFLSFNQVQALRIRRFDLRSFLPIFERCFAQFIPTLRSLHLPDVVGGIHEVVEFICRFPHLDDLSLTLSSCHWVDTSPRSPMEHSPPLRGKLILRGWGTISARSLLEIPGGLHFRSIDAGGVEREELDEILLACSPTLEVFSFRPRSCKFAGRGLLRISQSLSSLYSVGHRGPESKFGPNPVGSARGSRRSAIRPAPLARDLAEDLVSGVLGIHSQTSKSPNGPPFLLSTRHQCSVGGLLVDNR